MSDKCVRLSSILLQSIAVRLRRGFKTMRTQKTAPASRTPKLIPDRYTLRLSQSQREKMSLMRRDEKRRLPIVVRKCLDSALNGNSPKIKITIGEKP